MSSSGGGLLETLESLFTTRDLYIVLGFDTSETKDKSKRRSATEGQLKKAYHKSSLKYHPDRVAGQDETQKEEATQKFQALGAVYKILCDKDSKAVYDETGEIPDDDSCTLDPDKDWTEYWRILFKKITLDDIKEFEEKFRGSPEEDEELKNAYIESEGKMDVIIDSVMCATIDDEDRFHEKISEWLEEGSVPKFPSWKKQMSKGAKGKRKKKADAEAAEAEAAAAEIGLTKENSSLANLIMKRQADRAQQQDAFFDQLAAKYAKPSGKKKGKK